MKSSVIITADFKEKQVERAIRSCLNQSINNIEIIVVFSYLKNILYLKNKYRNVIFLQTNKKKNPIHDQIFKIKSGYKKSQGKNIFLLDGDDYFMENKIRKINLVLGNKRIIILNDHIIKEHNNFKYKRKKWYKKLFFYKIFFNSWPDKICTSSIAIPKNLLKIFFIRNNIYKYNYIAIDVLLILFFYNIKLKIFDEILTVKDNTYSGIDKNISNIYSKVYWLRRKEQHDFFRKNNKKIYTLEELICTTISLFIKRISKI